MTKTISAMSYQCPRCGYGTNQKGHMFNHLFKRKKPCHTDNHMIDLTNDIKEHVLNYGKYHIEPQTKSIVKTTNNSQNINNYYVLSNILSKMDPVEKLTEYVNYKGVQITDYEEYVENLYSDQVEKLENEQVKHFSLNKQDLLEIVDKVTSFEDVTKCNFIYDTDTNKFSFYNYGKWKSLLHDAGVKEIIENIQKCYLDSYELYLLKKYDSVSCMHLAKQQVREHLEEYYKFLSCFSIEPYVANKTNAQILGLETTDEEYDIQDKWMNIFKDLQKQISVYDCNKVRKEVANIAKINTKKSIVDLNKKMMEVFNMDEEFKQMVIAKITCVIEEDLET